MHYVYRTDALIFFRLAVPASQDVFRQKLFIIFNRVFNYRRRSITDFLVVTAKIAIRCSKSIWYICIYIYYHRLSGVSCAYIQQQRSFNYRTGLSRALFPSLNLSDTQLVTRASVLYFAYLRGQGHLSSSKSYFLYF